MKRVLIGAGIGMFVTLFMCIATSGLMKSKVTMLSYIPVVMPFVIGGSVAGFYGSAQSWLSGLLGSVLSIGFVWVATITFVGNPRTSDIYIYGTISLICGVIGGIFGGFLAQIWHKRMQPTSAPQQNQDSQHVKDTR